MATIEHDLITAIEHDITTIDVDEELPDLKSGNVWWLAIPSFGESWHNLHHADPTCARHGVKGQLDPSARVIRWFEQLGWARDVRWPDPDRIAARTLVDDPIS